MDTAIDESAAKALDLANIRATLMLVFQDIFYREA